jgi:hypothetical protein
MCLTADRLVNPARVKGGQRGHCAPAAIVAGPVEVGGKDFWPGVDYSGRRS